MPTPPKITSLAARPDIGTAPPRPVKDSSAALTEPLEVTVVVVAHSADSVIPLRCSLPSMLPPVEPWKAVVCRPAACWAAVPCCSAGKITAIRATHMTSIAAKIAQPWRWAPTMRP